MQMALHVADVAVLIALYVFLAAVFLLVWREARGLSEDLAHNGDVLTGRLVVLQPGNTEMQVGDTFRLEGYTTIGRSSDNVIVLSDHSVSARHAVLTYQEGFWWLQDSASTNGTMLNGAKISSRLPLRAQDVVALGKVQLRLEEI
jgi:pSer/pThr/pTyr-binding forkhead associated (FHA) protein